MSKVNPSDIIDAIEFQFGESTSFIDKRTNKVCTITQEEFSAAEEEEEEEDDDDDDYPEWMEKKYTYLEDNSNFIKLPSQYDADEYQMMEDFAYSRTDQHNQDKLLIAFSGKGAFRRFKDTVDFLGIADSWYKYRDKKYKEFVLEWCKMEEIEISE